MKELFQGKFHLMLKFLINQFAISIFGIMVVTPFMYNSTMLALAGVFSILLFYFIIWFFVNEDGQKDGIKTNAGRFQGKLYAGLVYCALAHLPSFFLALVNVILSCVPSLPGWLETIRAIINIFVRLFLYGMFTGVNTALCDVSSLYKSLSDLGITFLAYSIPTLAVCGVAYYFGFRGIKILKDKSKK